MNIYVLCEHLCVNMCGFQNDEKRPFSNLVDGLSYTVPCEYFPILTLPSHQSSRCFLTNEGKCNEDPVNETPNLLRVNKICFLCYSVVMRL